MPHPRQAASLRRCPLAGTSTRFTMGTAPAGSFQPLVSPARLIPAESRTQQPAARRRASPGDDPRRWQPPFEDDSGAGSTAARITRTPAQRTRSPLVSQRRFSSRRWTELRADPLRQPTARHAPRTTLANPGRVAARAAASARMAAIRSTSLLAIPYHHRDLFRTASPRRPTGSRTY